MLRLAKPRHDQSPLTRKSLVKLDIELPAKSGPEPSRNDYVALALARQEACTLLTGDANLWTVANMEQVNVEATR